MPTITFFTKDQFELFKSMGEIIDNQYFHLPQYFKSIGNGQFEVLNSFDELPNEMKELAGCKKKSTNEIKKYKKITEK